MADVDGIAGLVDAEDDAGVSTGEAAAVDGAVAGTKDSEGLGGEAAVDEAVRAVVEGVAVGAEGAGNIGAGEVADYPATVAGGGNAGGAGEAGEKILNEGDAVALLATAGAVVAGDAVVGTVDIIDVVIHEGAGLLEGETATGDGAVDADTGTAESGIDGVGAESHGGGGGIIDAIGDIATRPVGVHAVGVGGVARGVVAVHDVG